MKALVPASLLPLLLLAPLAAQDVDLKVAPKKNTTSWFLHTMKQEQSIDFGGQQMESGSTLSWAYQITVKDVDDKGIASLEARIERIKGVITIPMMGDTEFDSATAPKGKEGKEGKEEDAEDEGGMGMPDFSSIGKTLTKFAGKSFTATIDEKGKVTLGEDATKLLESSMAGGNEMTRGMASGMASKESLSRLVEESFGSRPEKPLAVGAKWTTDEVEKANNMPIKSKLEMTLAKCDDASFEITATGTIEKSADVKLGNDASDEDAEGMKAMLESMKMKNGKLTSMHRISRTDQFVIESKSVSTMDIEMDSPMGGEMSMTNKSTTTTKRTTAAEAMATGKTDAKADSKEPAGSAK